MSRRSADFPQVNRCKSEPSVGPVGSSNRVQLAAAAVVLAAMSCGLTHSQAVELAGATAMVGVACALQPERAPALLAECVAVTVAVVRGVQRRAVQS